MITEYEHCKTKLEVIFCQFAVGYMPHL